MILVSKKKKKKHQMIFAPLLQMFFYDTGGDVATDNDVITYCRLAEDSIEIILHQFS